MTPVVWVIFTIRVIRNLIYQIVDWTVDFTMGCFGCHEFLVPCPDSKKSETFKYVKYATETNLMKNFSS